MKIEFSRQIFEKCSNIWIHGNMFNRSGVAPFVRMDGQTDMPKLFVACRNFVNERNNWCLETNYLQSLIGSSPLCVNTISNIKIYRVGESKHNTLLRCKVSQCRQHVSALYYKAIIRSDMVKIKRKITMLHIAYIHSMLWLRGGGVLRTPPPLSHSILCI